MDVQLGQEGQELAPHHLNPGKEVRPGFEQGGCRAGSWVDRLGEWGWDRPCWILTTSSSPVGPTRATWSCSSDFAGAVLIGTAWALLGVRTPRCTAPALR